MIAYTFSDVLDYHKHIYSVLRRGSWQKLFAALWKEVSPVLDCVIKRLRRSQALVEEQDRRSKTFESVNISGNASAILGDQSIHIRNATLVPSEDFAAAQRFRDKLLEDLEVRQRHRRSEQLQACMRWLELLDQDRLQAQMFSRCRDERQYATCGWILSHPKFKTWLDPDCSKIFLWLKGKPGSGK